MTQQQLQQALQAQQKAQQDLLVADYNSIMTNESPIIYHVVSSQWSNDNYLFFDNIYDTVHLHTKDTVKVIPDAVNNIENMLKANYKEIKLSNGDLIYIKLGCENKIKVIKTKDNNKLKYSYYIFDKQLSNADCETIISQL